MNDRLEQFFKASPNVWIDGRRLAEVAGAYAWRSRCADIRKRGLAIENRQRRVLVYSDGIDNHDRYVTVSEYRLVPGQQMGLLGQRVTGCQCASMELGPCAWCDGPDREVM